METAAMIQPKTPPPSTADRELDRLELYLARA